MNNLPWGTEDELTDEEFFNRNNDIDFISSLLNTTENGTTPTILLTGVRGVGKTALIKKLKRIFDDKYLVCYINFSLSNAYQDGKLERIDIIKMFYDEFIKSCKEKKLNTVNKQIEKLFKTRHISIKGYSNFKDIPLPIPETKDNYTKLANFVMDLPQYIYEEYSDEIKGILIFMDEFQVIKELDNELNGFLWYLRSKIQSQKNVAYLFSGSMSIKDELIEKIAGKQGAFGGRMLTIEIEPFTYETTKRYLIEKSPELEFTNDGFERFYKCTRGTPFYINTFANLLPTNTKLDNETLINIFNKTLPILAIHFIQSWGRLTSQEQKIIICLLKKPLKRIEIAKKLEITSGSLGKPLKKLQDNVLIEINENGKYKIVDPILKDWLNSSYQKNGVYPYKTLI